MGPDSFFSAYFFFFFTMNIQVESFGENLQLPSTEWPFVNWPTIDKLLDWQICAFNSHCIRDKLSSLVSVEPTRFDNSASN